MNCSSKGFSPSFTYENREGWDVRVDVLIGNNVTTKCKGQMNMSNTDASETLSMWDVDDSYVREVPYYHGNDSTCGGQFEHYIDNTTGTPVEKIKYQVLHKIIFHKIVKIPYNKIVKDSKLFY